MYETNGLTAILYGILDAGAGVATGIVGFPVTSLINKLRPIWRASANEKIGLDLALGAAASGVRSVFVTKHVGLNVASDSLVTAATHRIGAGLVVIAGDDPGAKLSQNEQDSRYYGKIAEIPVIEPHGTQNAYEGVTEAFKVSEQLSVPIIVRITDRLLKKQGTVERAFLDRPLGKKIQKDVWELTHLGRHQYFLKRVYPQVLQFAETTGLNEEEGSGALGVISAGYASVLVEDALCGREDVAHLELGVTNPLCERRIAVFLKEHNRVLVVEEGAPFVEESIRGRVLGKLSGHVPRFGELTSADVERALTYFEADYITQKFAIETLQSRGYTGEICADCPFLPFYHALVRLDAMIAGDMGCTIRTANPPFKLIDVAYSLGSAIGVACGFEQGGLAVLGDCAFLHSGVEALISAIVFKHNVKAFVLENRVSAITGGQSTPAVSDLVATICRNYGVPYTIVEAQDMDDVSLQNLLRAVSNSTGTIVVVLKAACPKHCGCL